MRKAKVQKRALAPDPRYNDTVVTRFVNELMYDGKKSLAYKLFYGAVDKASASSEEADGYELWKKALDNIMPAVEVKARRMGGATFQVPVEVRAGRKTALGMKWLIKYARDRKGNSMEDKLAAEIVAASKGEGAAVKKKEDTHKMAEANKAFSHFKF